MKQTTATALYQRRDDRNVYMHDEATSFRFEIEGGLAGDAARQLEQS